MMNTLTDSHAHLDDKKFENDLDNIVQNAVNSGISFILNPGCEEKSSETAVALSQQYDIVYAAVGFHPSDCLDFNLNVHIPMLKNWCTLPKTLAIGEIGLDYYYDDGAPRDVQKKVFEAQIDCANELGVPIIVHDRDAHKDCFDMVKACLKPETCGVFHSYSGSVEMARQLLDLGLYLSVGGPLTFKNSRKLPEVVAYVPMDRLLIETDSPYLTPHPYRGKRNQPAYVSYVAEAVATVKKLPYQEVLISIYDNCNRLFHFKAL